MKIWLSHPTGNTFVRALLAGMVDHGCDYEFFTSFGITAGRRWVSLLPGRARAEVCRRSYEIPAHRLHTRSARELCRLGAERLFRASLPRNWRGVDFVYRDLDSFVADRLSKAEPPPDFAYCYEDGALATFKAASARGIRCAYELPIAYWKTAQKLLAEEAERLPRWEPTLGATRDSQEKLERKSEEIALADQVVCPSHFVLRSIPDSIRNEKSCLVAPFGSPSAAMSCARNRTKKLRVLFAGTLSQRKGLADLFVAFRLLNRSDLELIVTGTAVMPLDFYREECPHFVYEAPRPHAAMLALMQTCDLLVLPSIVEGRALVQQEALACGLPLVVTPNAGGEDLIEEGRTGFLVPTRSPAKIAEKLQWFAENRSLLEEMRPACQAKAALFSWSSYAEVILAGLRLIKDSRTAKT